MRTAATIAAGRRGPSKKNSVDGALAAARHFDLEELSSTITLRVGSLLTRRALRRFRRRVDYSEYGGASLLGAAGVTIVGHGRSHPLAVRNAVVMAYRFASDGFMQRVEQEIAAVAAA